MDEASVLRCGGDVAELADVRAFVRRSVAALGAGAAVGDDIVQAVDEWMTNVAVHGYRGAGGPVEVEIAREADRIAVRIRDRAPTFDPATAPAFDPLVPLERRRPGGMGIHLIRAITDRFVHRALPGGGNEVTMLIALDGDGGSA